MHATELTKGIEMGGRWDPQQKQVHEHTTMDHMWDDDWSKQTVSFSCCTLLHSMQKRRNGAEPSPPQTSATARRHVVFGVNVRRPLWSRICRVLFFFCGRSICRVPHAWRSGQIRREPGIRTKEYFFCFRSSPPTQHPFFCFSFFLFFSPSSSSFFPIK